MSVNAGRILGSVSLLALLSVLFRFFGTPGALLTLSLLVLLYLVRVKGRSTSEDRTRVRPRRAHSTTPEKLPELVTIELGDELDLHAFSPSETRDLVADFLDSAAEKGLSVVRIVHGKGRGVQRNIVHSLLARHPRVLSFRDAPPERGSWGATLAYLRPLEEHDEVD